MKNQGGMIMSEMSTLVKCLHCEGTGICHQSTIVKANQKTVTHDEDHGDYSKTVIDYIDVWEKAVCKICGESKEVHTEGKEDTDLFYSQPEKLICMVCGGSGYIGATPYFRHTKNEGNDGVISK